MLAVDLVPPGDLSNACTLDSHEQLAISMLVTMQGAWMMGAFWTTDDIMGRFLGRRLQSSQRQGGGDQLSHQNLSALGVTVVKFSHMHQALYFNWEE